MFRGAASAGAASGILSLTISKPAATAQGNVMVASIAVRPNTAIITAPTAWTLLRRMDNATATANSLAVYYKVAGAGEPASYTWTFSTSTGSAGGIQTFSGVDTAAPIDVENGQNTVSGLTHTTLSVTTTVANTMLVTSHSFSTAATWTPPGGMTEAVDRANVAVPNAVGISLEANYALQAAAGATGTKTATASNDADVGNAHILALRPASDSDGDGVPNVSDNCPNWPNPAQGLPPWPIPTNDPDCDGFSTAVENAAGTNALVHCGADAWPADITNNTFSDTGDIGALTGSFGLSVPPAPARYNIAPDPVDTFIDTADIAKMTSFFSLSCS